MLTKAIYSAVAMTTDTTTFAYNNANEQTSMVNGGTTTNMAYDAWGNLTSKTQGSYSATYTYRYGGKLYSVTSDFPGEGNVTYETGGDQKRRSRVQGSNELWFNWDVGWNIISQEDNADGSTGALAMTHVFVAPGAGGSPMLADLAGTTPSSGTARYYVHDHLGSTRSIYDATKTSVGSYEYTPYGSEYVFSGAALASLGGAFTGKMWDSTSKMYYFPYRYYSPSAARWTSRDPLGMADGPNVYAYVKGNPTNMTDPDGRLSFGWCMLLCRIPALILCGVGCNLMCDGLGPLGPACLIRCGLLCAIATTLLCTLACLECDPPVLD